MIYNLPKAELHVHLEGTITPALVQRLAIEKKAALDKKIFTSDFSSFTWENFSGFHKVFDESLKVISTAEDYAFITYLYLKQLAEQQCLYAELIVAPFHAEKNGVAYGKMLEGLVTGITQAKTEFGIEGRILIAFIRHHGPQASEKYLQEMLSQRHPYVVGINLVGDIKQYEIKTFEKIFSRARAHGLKASFVDQATKDRLLLALLSKT